MLLATGSAPATILLCRLIRRWFRLISLTVHSAIYYGFPMHNGNCRTHAANISKSRKHHFSCMHILNILPMLEIRRWLFRRYFVSYNIEYGFREDWPRPFASPLRKYRYQAQQPHSGSSMIKVSRSNADIITFHFLKLMLLIIIALNDCDT
jgi:hypothetical protein